ncbi:MAG: acetyltransferase [Flavobacteriales bacterium]|nr:acetyltransferase [Flavobacteriales bacterium]|tara:strand:+ start:23390 stop:23968 length:579 start_codon:yes stop_codon:yes gene_type:complete
MGLLLRVKNKIKYLLNSSIKPEMIGYTNWNSEKRIGLRISNFSHLSNAREIILKDYVFIGHFNYLDGHSGLEIGEGVQVSNYVTIATHSSHNAIRMFGKKYGKLNKHDIIQKGKVEIGDYTYVGPHVVITPNTKIGKGCIISAFSFVKGDIPDYSIVRGIPGEIIGTTKDIDNEFLKKYPDLEESYYQSRNF